MSQPAVKFISEQEYLEFERASQERHEYYRGEIFAMAGASFQHNVIEDNLRIALGAFLKDKKCRSLGSNLRISIRKNTLYTYPDIVIICGKPEFVDDEFDTLLNPVVIIEILSPSTANYDRGSKFDLYRDIETLKEYILIDSTKVHFVHYSRNADETWTLSEKKDLNDQLFISTVSLQLPLQEVYSGTELE